MARVTMIPGWERQLDRPVDALLDEVTEDVAEDARRLAPVDTGRLRASISAGGHKVTAGVDYAAYVELGTRYMDAQPYLRPALYKKRG